MAKPSEGKRNRWGEGRNGETVDFFVQGETVGGGLGKLLPGAPCGELWLDRENAVVIPIYCTGFFVDIAGPKAVTAGGSWGVRNYW